MGQKNRLHIMIIFGIVLLYGTIVQAASGVTLEILGKRLTNLPYKVENGELMVPARVLVKELGGQVTWQSLLKVLIVTFDDGLEIKMQVGNKKVSIQPGDQVKELGAAPCQVQGQTLIPVQFIARQFGYFYKWDESKKIAKIYKPTNWVQGLNFEDDLQGETLVIFSTKKVAYTSYILSDPDRLVIDLNDSALSVKASGIYTEHYAFKNIKIAQNNAETVRIVVYLNHPIQYKISDEVGEDGFKVKIAFAVGIRNVELTEQGLLIRSTGEIGQYKVIEYSNPERLVVDIPDQTLQLLNNTIPINHPQIKQVRSSQHSWDPKIVRLVLDLNEKIEYNILRGKIASEIIIQPKSKSSPSKPESTGTAVTQPVEDETKLEEDKKPEKTDSEKSEDSVTISDSSVTEMILGTVGKEYGDRELVSVGITKGLNQKVFLNTSTPTTYSVWYLPKPDRLVVDIKGVTTRLPAKLSGDNKNILSVRIHQYSEKVRVVFDLSKYDKHEVFSDKRTQKIDVGLGQNPLYGKIIVIDPGHGGSDPGAIGPSGSHEKNFNLSMGLQVRNLLRSAGATVVLTRDSDVYPTLSERVDLANQLNADIFISIHCNSLPRIDPSGTNNTSRVDPGGTETFISPKRQESLILAQLVQANVVKSIGLYDRGVKSNEYYVLVNTTMPAVLVEVAFVAKADEEALLLTEEFQNKAAQGIYQGILAYFAQITESCGVEQ